MSHGYTESFVKFVSKFRDAHPRITVMAGQCRDRGMTRKLILAGADISRSGIGPGSVCTTRIMTGGGLPSAPRQ